MMKRIARLFIFCFFASFIFHGALYAASNQYDQFIFQRVQDKKSYFDRYLKTLLGTSLFDGSYAIIIAVGEYEYLPRLEAAEHDAEKMKEFLFSTGEYDEVIVLRDADATFGNIQYFMVNYLPRKMLKQGRYRLMFYFTGHASQQKFDDRPIGYFQLKGATGEFIGDEVIDMDQVEMWMNRLQNANHMLFLFDACFSGLAGVELKTGYDTRIDPRSLAEENGHYLITSGGAHETAIASLKRWGGSLFTDVLINGMKGSADVNADGLVTTYELFTYVQAAVKNESRKVGQQQTPLLTNIGSPMDKGQYFFVYQNPENGGNEEFTYVRKAPVGSEKTQRRTIVFDEKLPDDLTQDSEIVINGQRVQVYDMDSQKKSIEVQYLGEPEGLIKQGLNWVFSGISDVERKWLFWNEGQKLKFFNNPYSNSHAILVAIDDYKREHDPQSRGRTGFQSLNSMVSDSEKLKQVLHGIGFPFENIQTFYNEEATSNEIQEALKAFWKGGKFDSSDILFFYFGGHGYTYDNDGYLITYDFDSEKPAFTSIAMEDLTTTYFRNITAHHMLIALDSCYSGLTLLDNGYSDEEKLKEFRELSLIKNDTEPEGRNILVAGTGDQKAVYDNGGIFTKVLTYGLQGKADLNKDGLIQFEELGFYVRNTVIVKAREMGKKQEPKAHVFDRFGEGRMVFLLTPQ